ncbi:hypothetical protein [Pelagimonas varians]|uniref:NADH dehydrogenase subunit E n=1 Tax=Pelagimonas varians TaxID=696760 RepID=A0A238JRJ5_9RHOB|nr:hypothetical protein [Pelagimonas varians]PYG34631.1 putative flap endonuclease-1-like 5' DNA nuclease [Pelagimonas varians]SMX33175.1 NADH dehydrogenase subunit E [Pelagimonas varians]
MTITTPMMKMTPDFTPVARAFALQTRIAGQSSETMMRLAMLPWNSWTAGVTALKTTPAAKPAAKPQAAPVAVAKKAAVAKPLAKKAAPKTPEKSVADVAAKPVALVAETPVAAKPVAVKPEAAAPVAPAKIVAAPVADKPVAKAKPVDSKPAAPVAAVVAETKPVPKAAAKVEAKPEIKAAAKVAPKAETKADADKPAMLKAARNGQPDDLTQLKGVGPKLALALQEAGIYHYDQIAEWTDVQTAWVDENIAGVRGRASRNEWVEQALELATA